MAKYVLVYYGGGGMPQTEAQQKASMEAWGAWLGGLGSAVTDAGNPFSGAVSTVAPGGSTREGGVGEPASGYSIVEADSLAGATDLAKGCPILGGGGSVAVYETINVM